MQGGTSGEGTVGCVESGSGEMHTGPEWPGWGVKGAG